MALTNNTSLKWCILCLSALLIHSTLAAADKPWFSLQVGAFAEQTRAERALSFYDDKGMDPFYRYEDAGSKGMWYRVYVGRYPTREAARKAAENFKQRRILKNWILRTMTDSQPDSVPAAQSVGQDSAPDLTTQAQVATAGARIDPEPALTAEEKKERGSTTPAPELVVAPPAEANDTGIRLTLLDAVRYSLEGNREIAVISFEPQKAKAQMESAESVYDTLLFADATFRRDPNLDSSITEIVTEDDVTTRAGVRKPMKTGGTISTYLETRYGDLNNTLIDRSYKHTVAPTVELKQPLLNNIGSKEEQATIKIAKYQANVSDAEFIRKVFDVTDRVVRAYWKLYLHRELVTINRKNLDMAEEVRRREAERFAGGISQQLDVARARSNAQARRSTWLGSLEAYQITMDRLKLLLNWGAFKIDTNALVVPVEAPKTETVTIDVNAAIERALNNRPEIIKAKQELMIREVDQALAAHQQLPKLDFIGRYSVSGYGEEMGDAWDDVSMDEDDSWEVGLQFEWAFGNRLAKSQLRKKSLGRQQANAQLMRIADDIKLEVKQVLTRLATLEDELQASQLAREAAEKVVEGEFTRFDIGQTSNEELLRAQDLLAVTSRSVVRAIVDYNTALQDLASIQGILPKGIVMEKVAQ
jgi:outer membrane protein TolC